MAIGNPDHRLLPVGDRSWDRVEWNDLALFRAVAEELSFTRAARRARVSQPWLSARIKRLERRIGHRLFERSSHHVSLTPAGRHLVAGVQEMTATWSDTCQALDRLDVDGRRHDRAPGADTAGTVAAELRLGLFDINPIRLAPLLHDLHERRRCRLVAPGDIATGLEQLAAGSCDALLAYFFDAEAAADAPAPVVASTVLRDRLHAFVAADHPVAALPSVPISALSEEAWIVRCEPELRRQHVDLSSPLFIHPDTTVLRPLGDPLDSVFLLYTRPEVPTSTAEALIHAVRRWYVEGLLAINSEWLAQMDGPDAHPTLHAALAGTGRRAGWRGGPTGGH